MTLSRGEEGSLGLGGGKETDHSGEPHYVARWPGQYISCLHGTGRGAEGREGLKREE